MKTRDDLTPVECKIHDHMVVDLAYLFVQLENMDCSDKHAFLCIERLRYHRDVLFGLTDEPFEVARKDELEYIENNYPPYSWESKDNNPK